MVSIPPPLPHPYRLLGTWPLRPQPSRDQAPHHHHHAHPSGVELQLPSRCALHPQGLLGTVVPGTGAQPGLCGCFTGQPLPASLPRDREKKKQHSGLLSTCCVRPGAALWKEKESLSASQHRSGLDRRLGTHEGQKTTHWSSLLLPCGFLGSNLGHQAWQ